MMRTRCEVYSRSVGYIRPVEAWNDSKQAEFKDRSKYDAAVKALVEKEEQETLFSTNVILNDVVKPGFAKNEAQGLGEKNTTLAKKGTLVYKGWKHAKN